MLKSKAHQIAAWFIFLGIVAGYFLMAVRFPSAYIVATYEDLVGEWAQVFFFVTTMVLSFRIALSSSRYRLFFAVLALACLYVAGEEISWGQRIFDIKTPDFFKEHNLQNETNLHNFFTGPISTLTKQALEYIIAAGLVVYGLLYPWLIRLRWRLALWFDGKGLPAPPLYLWPFFVLSAFLELGFLKFNEAEIAEILIPLALAIMALNYLQALQNQMDCQGSFQWEKPFAMRLARQTCVVVICILFLAVGTTAACYATPRLEKKIQRRYMNGVEKFADRYKRYEQWGMAAELYQQVHENEPQRTSVLRDLFRCYRELGEVERGMTYLAQAEELDLDYLQRKPDSISGNLSMARTLRLRGDRNRAEAYLEDGLENARKRVEKKPNSATAAYWLGKTLERVGHLPGAAEEYKRATGLRPGELKYQKAALRLRRFNNNDVDEADEK